MCKPSPVLAHLAVSTHDSGPAIKTGDDHSAVEAASSHISSMNSTALSLRQITGSEILA